MSPSKHRMKINLAIIVVANVLIIAALQIFYNQPEPNLALEQLRLKYLTDPASSVDHSKMPELQKEFESPGEVTETCISCHTERHKEVMASSHFNWERISYVEGRGVHGLGKRNVLNNFCIGTQGNELACAKCHTGYGMENIESFDFAEPKNVDCLSCHDNSDQYQKGSAMAGYPAESVDLSKAAQSVAEPTIENCGSCHFFSGGGNNVKHGDLEKALFSATRETDVHMGADGINMNCVDCHTAENHQMKGKLYSVSSNNVNRLLCEDCHSNTPHLSDMLNTHTAKVACQTCHIPTYAKENPTKMEWKWSEAGDLKEGQPYHKENEQGKHTYLSIKGEFEWASNVEPDYTWFNGKAQHYFMGDTIDTTSGPVQINRLLGSHDDPDSKIVPVKIHRGDQIYDKENLMLIQPKLFAPTEGDSAFWKDFDWNIAAAAGMQRAGLPYSGEYGFIETEMYWPVNHMVSPADQSLSCESCHTRNDGRLAGMNGFYLPGRDNHKLLDNIGSWMILLAIIGVVLHGSIRIAGYIRSAKDLEMKDYEEFEDEAS